MHPDLSSHLHTDPCNDLIVGLKTCHKEFPVRKFIGHCNDIDALLVRCLKGERLKRRANNANQAKIKQEEIRNRIGQSMGNSN